MKWVAIWGAAMAPSERREADFARNLTLRYTVRAAFSGERLRIRLSAVCNKFDAAITKLYVSVGGRSVRASFNGNPSGIIPAGGEIMTDEIAVPVKAGDDIDISMYFADFTEMATSVTVLGPLMKARFAEGDFAAEKDLPHDKSQTSGQYHFLDTVEILTEDKNRAVIAFGDSITAQSWVDFANITLAERESNTVIIRRGASGARLLGQYDCLPYKHYGLSMKNRFERETTAAGADSVIAFIGVNDIIHPDGINPYRPMENFPSEEQMISAYRYMIESARSRGMRLHLATILPFGGWRTDAPFREELRCRINEWISSPDSGADGYLDFASALDGGGKLLDEYDSGDHLHPNRTGAARIAKVVTDNIDSI